MNKEKRNTEENKALVKSKAGLVREKFRKLEEQIELVETGENNDYWAEVDDTVITRTMNELNKWDIIMTEADEKFLEFKELVGLHGERSNAEETGYNLASIKDLLLELGTEVKDAKLAVQEQDKN